MIGLVGADHVLLGSDYPYDMAMLDCVAHVRVLKISDADKAAILGGHAETLLAGSVTWTCKTTKPPRSGRRRRAG